MSAHLSHTSKGKELYSFLAEYLKLALILHSVKMDQKHYALISPEYIGAHFFSPVAFHCLVTTELIWYCQYDLLPFTKTKYIYSDSETLINKISLKPSTVWQVYRSILYGVGQWKWEQGPDETNKSVYVLKALKTCIHI